MLDGTAFVMRSTMLTDMLDAPIPKLAMGKEVDFCKHLFNSRALNENLATFHEQVKVVAPLGWQEEGRGTHLFILYAVLEYILNY